MVRTRSSSHPETPGARRGGATPRGRRRTGRAGGARGAGDLRGARLGGRPRRALAVAARAGGREPMTRPARLVAGGCVAFAAGLGALAVLQHRAFWTGRFDVGNLVQAVWSTAHGDVLSVTGLTGRQISRLGAHFDPIVVLFAPLWWVWPDASMLLVAQALAVATGAIPVYLLARRHLRLRLGRRRIRARLPSPPGDAVARPRRLPPGRARDAAASLGILVPRLRPARRVRRGRRRSPA